MSGITRFEDIDAWKAARELTSKIYAVTCEGTFAKDYGLKDQIQRAATSIMANVACPVKPVKYIFSIFGDLYE